jgi:(E)-4-hydroxy-3-methyl-but-2-enyl pyrophosphate reductase
MKKITRADYSGFCFGVKRAIEKTCEAVADKKADEEIYTGGPLIHNKAVTDELEKKGVRIIYNLDEAEDNATVIIRSHGEPESFYKKAADRGVKLIDATCPFVEKIHTLVKKAHDDGYTVVIAGDKNHPEVIGINGWCDNSAIVVETADEASKITSDRVFVVAQTTVTEEIFNEVCRNINAKECITRNTICNATIKRQESCIELAKKSDIMVIIGSKNSSNTQKLYNVSKKHCTKTYFVENIEDLP